jgi:hypothetical protein
MSPRTHVRRSGLVVLAVASSFVGVIGCFHSLDREMIKCSLDDPSSCPPSYECWAVEGKGARCHKVVVVKGDGSTGADSPVAKDGQVLTGEDGRPAPDVPNAPDAALDAPSTSRDASLGAGGLQGSGGTTGLGGIIGAGGIQATGGKTGAGGIQAAGGKTGTGGTIPGTGGIPIGAGGVTGTGGTIPGTGGITASGGSTGYPTNPHMTGGSQGIMGRTWTCCKPACGSTIASLSCKKDGTTRMTSTTAISACGDIDPNSGAYACYDFAPWYDPATNLSYGFAIGPATTCGTCYMLEFSGESKGTYYTNAQALRGQQMIVQVIDLLKESYNFTLYVPGGGTTTTIGCSSQWGSTSGFGLSSGGFLEECKGVAACIKDKCGSFGGVSPTMKAGCTWYADWLNAADNSVVYFKLVTCPSQITARSGVTLDGT